MNKKRCLHCRAKFYPYRHIKKQKYCSKKSCQAARQSKWRQLKLKSDQDYQNNKKTAHYTWKAKHPNYWNGYHKKVVAKKKSSQKSPLKVLIKKEVLTNWRKTKTINCDCQLVLIP